MVSEDDDDDNDESGDDGNDFGDGGVAEEPAAPPNGWLLSSSATRSWERKSLSQSGLWCSLLLTLVVVMLLPLGSRTTVLVFRAWMLMLLNTSHCWFGLFVFCFKSLPSLRQSLMPMSLQRPSRISDGNALHTSHAYSQGSLVPCGRIRATGRQRQRQSLISTEAGV